MDISQLNKINDEEHLRLLVIFHRIYGIIKILFSIVFIAYIYLINNLFKNPGFYTVFHRQENLHVPPKIFFEFFFLFMSFMIVFHILVGILTIISGQFIKEKKYRMFSIIIACVNCVSFPLGTALGAFTIVVLFRNSVADLYTQLNTAENKYNSMNN